MTKQEQELRQAVADFKASAKELMEQGKQAEAKAKLEEAKEVKAKLDNFLEMQSIEVREPENKGAKAPMTTPKAQKVEYKDVFMKAIRKQSLNAEESQVLTEYTAKLNEHTGSDGGFIVPEDITTTINQLKLTEDALEQYVNVQTVSTLKGSRTLEVRAASTPFAKMSEYGDPTAMTEITAPTFSRLSYEIEDYAGFLPVSNDLLADTDQNLSSYLTNWLAKKSKATRNSLIIAALETLTKKTLADTDAIKKVLNVELDPAHSTMATIFTNQDGFNFLDTLKDKDGNYLLQPNPLNATGKMLFGRPVVVLSNATIPTASGDLAPIIIGDLKEAVILWDRKQLLIDQTNTGGSAWRTNSTEFRCIEREDVTLWDSKAVVYGQIDITPTV